MIIVKGSEPKTTGDGKVGIVVMTHLQTTAQATVGKDPCGLATIATIVIAGAIVPAQWIRQLGPLKNGQHGRTELGMKIGMRVRGSSETTMEVESLLDMAGNQRKDSNTQQATGRAEYRMLSGGARRPVHGGQLRP